MDSCRKRTISIKYILLLAFIIPIVILALAYYKHGIYPGGTNTVLTMDMGSQYMAFWASLRYLGHSDNSVFFNMSGALGNNFFGFAYYIFSPLTWITVLFPIELLPDAIYFLTLIRIGLCGLGFCYYLFYTYQERWHKLAIFLLSCCYALMSYNVGYSLNLMWLDAVLMLPWILIGIERIIRENKELVFIISVFFSLVCNYYITFMSAVFAIIYLFIRLSETGKWNLKVLGKYVVSAILGVGMAMPVLLPGILALENGKMEENVKPITSIFRYRLIDVVNQLFSGRYDTLLDNGLPLIFCGSATVVLVILYFVKSKDTKTIKVLWLFAIIFYLFSMCFVPLDRIMHGFNETTCFEARYSYSFSCLLLILAYRGVDSLITFIKGFSTKWILHAFAAVFVLVELYMNSSILISGIMIEMKYGPRSEYDMVLQSKKELVNSIKDLDFYRISDYMPYTFNDGAWLGYNSIGYFSSCYNLELMNFLGLLGENQSYHVLKDGIRTPFEESFLGARYRISYYDWCEKDDIIDTTGLYSISKNDSALSLGYMIDKNAKDSQVSLGKNAFENQNTIARELSGLEEGVFVELEVENYNEDSEVTGFSKHAVFDVKSISDSMIWMFFEKADDVTEFNTNKDTKLIVNEQNFGSFIDPDSDSPFIIYLGKYHAGEQIDIEYFSNIRCEEFHVCYLNDNAFNSVMNRLGDKQLKVVKHSGGHFYGIIDAGDGGDMLLTLPSINGWKIKVDEKKVSPGNYRNILLTVPMSRGEHTVDIRFVSPGVYLGIAIGVVNFLIILVSYHYRKNHKASYGIDQVRQEAGEYC